MIAINRSGMLQQRADDPTPEQIERRSAEVRKGWGSREHARRQGHRGADAHWTPPTVSMHDVGCSLTRDGEVLFNV